VITPSPPKQRRSREALDRAIEAATEILKEVGYDAMRITDVSQRANVGPASIYARVGSKHGLLLAVQLRMIEQLDSDIQELSAPLLGSAAPLPALIKAAVENVATLFRRHEDLLRVFMVRGDVDETIIEHGSAATIRHANLFAEVLLARRDEIAHPDPERAVDIAFRLVYDTLARRVVLGANFESPRALSWDDEVQELGIACAAYLLHARDVPVS
jgi:AcrR family transcriptional regulator